MRIGLFQKTTSRRQVILEFLGLTALTGTRRLFAANPLPAFQKRSFSVPLVDDQGQIVSRYDASALYFAEDIGGGVTLDMGLIPGGAFDMGSISNVPLPPTNMREQPVHRVSVRPFALGVFPVTRAQWRQVSTLPKISRSLEPLWPTGVSPDIEDRLPIDLVDYVEAIEFCQRLLAYTGRPYRLPNEAEWEYSCRAGTDTKYHFGDGISLQVANYNGTFRPLALTPVGSKQAPNRFGLHDMHGNVLEWCVDWLHTTYEGAPVDGSAWTYNAASDSRIGRGGSYVFGKDSARSASRYPSLVGIYFSGQGFRVALDFASGLLDPKIRANGVTNGASAVAAALAPGEIFTIQGSNIGPNTSATLALDERGFVGKELMGTRVLFDGVPAPLLYVSADQVKGVVPYAVAGQTSTQVMVDRQGQTSAPVSVPVVEISPAIFTADSSGQGQGAILNQDGSPNSANNPAARGSIVSVFATGEGQTNPPGVDGKIAASPLPVPVSLVQLSIGDVMTDIQYMGAAPGEVAGVLQVNARVPDTIQNGLQPVVLRIGQTISQPGVFMMVG